MKEHEGVRARRDPPDTEVSRQMTFLQSAVSVKMDSGASPAGYVLYNGVAGKFTTGNRPVSVKPDPGIGLALQTLNRFFCGEESPAEGSVIVEDMCLMWSCFRHG